MTIWSKPPHLDTSVFFPDAPNACGELHSATSTDGTLVLSPISMNRRNRHTNHILTHLLA